MVSELMGSSLTLAITAVGLLSTRSSLPRASVKVATTLTC